MINRLTGLVFNSPIRIGGALGFMVLIGIFPLTAQAGIGSINYGNMVGTGYQNGPSAPAAAAAAPANSPTAATPAVEKPYGGGDFWSADCPDGCTDPSSSYSAKPTPGTQSGGHKPAPAQVQNPSPSKSGKNNPTSPSGSTAKNQNGNGKNQGTKTAGNGNSGKSDSGGGAGRNSNSNGNSSQQAANQAASFGCASAFSLAQDACQGPLGGGMNNGALINTAGQVGAAMAGGSSQTAAGVEQNCNMGAKIAEMMAGGFATYAAACSAARSSCLSACTNATDDPTVARDQAECQAFSVYTQQGLQGLLQYGSTYIQAQNCASAAKANQLLVDCSAVGSSNNPQCATDCQAVANQSSPYCQAYFQANPCLAPNGANSTQCLCSKNPSDPVCAGTTPTASPLALSPSGGATPNSNGSLLAQFASQGNPGGLNRNPLYKGNKLGPGSSFGKPLTAQGEGGGLPNLGGPAGLGFGNSGSHANNSQGGGYNTHINKGFIASNAVLPVPLSAAGGGFNAGRGPASQVKPFTFGNLQKLLPTFAGAGGFRVVSKFAPKFGSSEITPANGLSNWQKVHLQYLRMAADHELMP